MNFKELKQQLEDVQGTWNGDLPGVDEERATTAKDALELVNELEHLLAELGI